jgi:hypothetical protein
MSRVVYIHVGAPKTGTTYLQDRLRLNAGELRDHGIHYPLGRFGLNADQFKAALDLIENDWGGALARAEGQWDALVREVRRLDGTVVISHEILAAANQQQVDRAMRDLRGSEIHVVYSARDLARQIPAEWQEGIKQRRKWSFHKFLNEVQTRSQTAPDLWFWKVQGLPNVLNRWSAGLSPERVHLVTVPPPNAPEGLLWRRFCQVFGIDPAWAPQESQRGNPSMGIAETALIRRLNAKLAGSEVDNEQYRALVKELLVHQNLANRDNARRATLPPHAYPWAEEVTEGWISWVEGSGIDVVGDVNDLRLVRPPADQPWVDPDRPNRKRMAEVALDALAVMTQEAARRPDPEQQLTGKVGKATRRIRER